jgi:atypical dual specificity phosphatase
MSSRIGQLFRNIEHWVTGSEQGEQQKVAKKADQVEDGADKVEDNAAKTNDNGVKAVGDTFVNVGAGVIGISELLGVKPGVSSPYQLQVDGTVTRSSEPDLNKAKQQGIQRVVNFQAENDDREKAAALGLNELYLPVVDNTPPTPEQLKQCIDFLVDARKQGEKVDVHCLTGRGRTGVAIAGYRMACYGWNPQQALDEAVKVGGTTLGVVNPLPNEREAILQFGKLLGWVQKADGTWERSNPSKIPGYPLDPPFKS